MVRKDIYFSKDLKIQQYFFLPRLQYESLYLSAVTQQKKKEVFLEVPNMNISYDHYTFSLLNMVESRFWLYQQTSSIDRRVYFFCFKLLELSTNTYAMDTKKRKTTSLNSFLYLFNARKFILDNYSIKSLVKSRIIALTKGGYLLTFYGKKAFLLRSTLFRKKLKNFTYSCWFISNLNLIGFLNTFALKDWNLGFTHPIKRTNKNFYLRKLNFYYKKNCMMKSTIVLEKN